MERRERVGGRSRAGRTLCESLYNSRQRLELERSPVTSSQYMREKGKKVTNNAFLLSSSSSFILSEEKRVQSEDLVPST